VPASLFNYNVKVRVGIFQQRRQGYQFYRFSLLAAIILRFIVDHSASARGNLDTDTNIVTHDPLEAEQDIIKRLDGVIEATIKTHEILEAKAKFGFTVLSSAMALVLFAYANVSDVAAKVTVDAIRLFVLFDLLAVFSTLAVMWPRYQPIAIIQPKRPALEKWRRLTPSEYRANLLVQYIKLWKEHEAVIAPKTSAFQAACLCTGVAFFLLAVILYQLTGSQVT